MAKDLAQKDHETYKKIKYLLKQKLFKKINNNKKN